MPKRFDSNFQSKFTYGICTISYVNLNSLKTTPHFTKLRLTSNLSKWRSFGLLYFYLVTSGLVYIVFSTRIL